MSEDSLSLPLSSHPELTHKSPRRNAEEIWNLPVYKSGDFNVENTSVLVSHHKLCYGLIIMNTPWKLLENFQIQFACSSRELSVCLPVRSSKYEIVNNS